MAPLMLLYGPLVAIALFAALRPAQALVWTVLLGYLFLPEGYSFDIAGLPPYDKSVAISLGVLLGALFFARKHPDLKDREIFNTRLGRILWLMIGVLLAAYAVTYVLNRSPMTVGGDRVLPAMQLRDVFSTAIDILVAITPFLIARRLLYTSEHHRMALQAVVVIGLAYSLLVLFEVRMSPQLNNWIYGYFPHSWQQHVRGGFRPIVFLRHGLWVGFFLLTTVLAAAALFRIRGSANRVLYVFVTLYLFAVLFLSKNTGALILGILFVPAVLFLPIRLQTLIAAFAALLFMTYPLYRASPAFPDDRLVQIATQISPKRAASLETRFENEARMLERAEEKPVFGWGGWGRSRVYSETGRDITLADGLWIVVLGVRGWVGFLTYMGLLTLPILLLWWRVGRRADPATAGLALIMGANFIYMIPNSTLSPVGWLMAGAIAGCLSYRQKDAASSAAPVSEEGAAREGPRYTRFSGPVSGRTSRAEASRPQFSRTP